MEDPIEKPQGLVARISALLNNEACSDVVFHVKHNGQRRMFYAHSAILVAAGNGFPELQKPTSQPKVIKISDFSPYIVEMMLTYLYTDELNIFGMENAVDLYKLAKAYSIEDLKKLCNNYIIKEEVNIDNLFVKYENALTYNFPKLLEKCRNLVRSETKAVFASRSFGDVPPVVVEDIFRLDHLNVSSELDVIQAALRWSASECRRKGRPTEKICLRDAIDPLLKHLRFLALSADEFCDLSAKDGNIFTGYETALLTRKILQPDYKGDFPKYFCPISRPREPYRKTSSHTAGMNNFRTEPVKQNTSNDPFSGLVNMKENYNTPIQKNNDNHPVLVPRNNYSEKYPVSAARNNFNDNYPVSVPRNNFNDSFYEPVSYNSFHDNTPRTFFGNNSNISSPEPVNSLKSNEGDAMFFRQNSEKSSPAATKLDMKPIFQYGAKKSTPMLKVMPQTQSSSKQTFDFSLKELKKDMRFASQTDIKCNAKIEMLTGAILIYGIELKVAEQRHIRNEIIEVMWYVTNNNTDAYDKQKLELKNNMLSLVYPEPIRVTYGNPTDIEVTIEDLPLNRCFACQGQTFELNNGLNCKAEISVKSNQPNGQDNILYLISRIIYSCSS